MTAAETVLVTGGAGFVGSHLSRAMMKNGKRVVALDLFDEDYDPSIKRRRVRTLVRNERFGLIEGDIRDGDLLRKIFAEEKIDMVYHLAAKVGVRESIDAEALYNDVNVRGTKILLDAMVDAGIPRLLFTSSSSVYGSAASLPFSEKDVVVPISPYGRSKLRGEELCGEYRETFGLDARIVRLFTLYGPDARPGMAFEQFFDAGTQGKPVEIFGDGSARRDFTWIGDGVRGMMMIGGLPEAPPVVNIGSGRTVSIASLVEMIAEEIGVEIRVEHLPPNPLDLPATEADITLAGRFGYAPEVFVREGIRRHLARFSNAEFRFANEE